MLRLLCPMLLGMSLFAANNLHAEDWKWAKEHPEAKEQLLKIFEKHEGFRDAITTYSAEHHGTFKELVEFLAEKREHTVEEFIRDRKKDDEETPHLRKIHEKHREGMADFREWIKDHKDAAVALVHHEHELEHLDHVAEKRDR